MENTNDKLALHAILIKKPCNLEEAQATAQEFIKDRKKKFYRETKNYFRFRNIPKTHFLPKCYKTKKINKNVSIIIGKLKPEFEHLEGSGLFDFFKNKANQVKQTVQNVVSKVSNIFTPRLDSYNNTSRKTLEQYGNFPIKSLTICRTPIMKVLDKTLNFLSLGKFSELKKKYGFDELFHLQLVANVDNKNVVIEKNEVININTSFKNDSKTQTYQIPLNKTFTINEMLEKARTNVGDHLYFSYSAFTNNCQSYIKYLLEGEGLFTPQAKDFLYQDIEELAKEMPQYVKTTANVLTRTGAVANKLMGKAKYNDKLYDQITGHVINYNEEPYIPKRKNYASQEEIKRMSTPDKNFDINAPLPPPIMGTGKIKMKGGSGENLEELKEINKPEKTLSSFIISKLKTEHKLKLIYQVEKNFYKYIIDEVKPTKKGNYNLDKAFTEWKGEKNGMNLSTFIISKIKSQNKLNILKKAEKNFYKYIYEEVKPSKKGNYNLDKAFTEWEKKDGVSHINKIVGIKKE